MAPGTKMDGVTRKLSRCTIALHPPYGQASPSYYRGRWSSAMKVSPPRGCAPRTLIPGSPSHALFHHVNSHTLLVVVPISIPRLLSASSSAATAGRSGAASFFSVESNGSGLKAIEGLATLREPTGILTISVLGAQEATNHHPPPRVSLPKTMPGGWIPMKRRHQLTHDLPRVLREEGSMRIRLSRTSAAAHPLAPAPHIRKLSAARC